MEKIYCKFCGKEITTEKYIRPAHKDRTCGECTTYCMKKCRLHIGRTLSWHDKPCTQCRENPYNKYTIKTV